ncbi:ankyrin repeat domain-containing protein [Thermophagus sp. OGC60D27]|uniref:ankyrin repeat domain-containing protein n=1 Tax=Thermophagus sp. OGC60D27 TaxID=3458415 RepID=UPI004037F7D4
MKTIQFIILPLLMIFIISCQTKPGKKNQTTDAKQETAERENTGTNQQLVSIHESAFNGNLEAVKAHINNNENLDATNPDGHTSLMLASFNGHTDVIKVLLQNGADVNIPDNKGLTPLHFAASGAFPETVSLLLENGAAINSKDQIEHFTPLMYAAAEGNIEVVKVLLEKGADTTLTDDDGDDAEAFAKQNNHTDIVEILQNQKDK